MFAAIFARKLYALPIKRRRAGKSCFLWIINKKDCIGNRSSVIYKNFCDAFLINYKYVWKDAKYCTQNILYVEVDGYKDLSNQHINHCILYKSGNA